MQPSPINFETWLANHPEDHDARWCRELYPWAVFNSINYNPSSLGLQQDIVVGSHSYCATINQRTMAENGRLNYLIRLRTLSNNQTQEWERRKWNDLFHLVLDKSGAFITLFTENKDPSKVLLRRFLNSQGGPQSITERLERIEEIRSLPISGLLFRSLLSYAAYEAHPGLNQFMEFPVIRQINTGSDLASGTYTPFLSINRTLWITYSFTEEKAHRLAIRLAKQAHKTLVVYCHPTFTRHHRCNDSSVSVISISQFLRILSPSIHQRYIRQARFLINHLRQNQSDPNSRATAKALIEDIKQQTNPIPIYTSDLRVAKSGLGNVVATTGDVAYVLACGNLLNAALNKRLQSYDGTQKLSKEVYSFKSILGQAIEDIINIKPPNVSVYVEGNGLVYVDVLGIQFSFHAIPLTPTLVAYQLSKANKRQEWSGLKLQPIAPLILKWAEAVLSEEK